MDDLGFAIYDLQGWLENLLVIDADLRGLCFSFGALLLAFFLLRLLLARGVLARQTNPNDLRRQVHHVPDGRLDGVIPSQIFVDGLRLCGRFDNNERTSHVTFVTPVCVSERADRGACVLLATFGACPWDGPGPS